jgi:hypothetical protein
MRGQIEGQRVNMKAATQGLPENEVSATALAS